MKRYLPLILLAGCGSSPPPPAVPKPAASDATTADQNATQAQADVDRATAEVERANEMARAEGLIITTETKTPPACCTTLVRKESLGKFGEVQIWKGPSAQTTRYVVVFGSAPMWRLAEPLEYVELSACSAPECVDSKLDDIEIARSVSPDDGNTTNEVLRVVFHVTQNHYPTEGRPNHDYTSTHDVVVACMLGTTPTCTDGR